MTMFDARYPGRCGVCDEAIRVGDAATYVEGEAMSNAPFPSALVVFRAGLHLPLVTSMGRGRLTRRTAA